MLRLAVRVRREQAEAVLAELLELAPSGVEELSVAADVVEYAVYGQPGELPALHDLTAAAGDALVEVHTERLADDWSERWRAFHQPFVLEGRLTVRPPWEAPGSTPIDLVIDPGQAFGTGSHASTRLCLELMCGLEPEGSFLDLGCGSGVLAIAAAKMGWTPVIAVDNDQAAVRASADNAARNETAVEVRRHDLRTSPLPPAETVAANLLQPLLLSWAAQLARADAVPTRVIASGVLHDQAAAVLDGFAACGLREAHREQAGEWTALLLER
jgi:ribosomal protein L11 methyltransferase